MDSLEVQSETGRSITVELWHPGEDCPRLRRGPLVEAHLLFYDTTAPERGADDVPAGTRAGSFIAGLRSGLALAIGPERPLLKATYAGWMLAPEENRHIFRWLARQLGFHTPKRTRLSGLAD